MKGLILSWVLLVIFTSVVQVKIPDFELVLRAFGADLPMLTLLTQKFFHSAVPLPAIACLVWAFWPDPKKRVRAATLFCWLSSLSGVLMAGSMYLPIIRLGAVV